MKKRKKTSLRKKLTVSMILFALVMVLAIGVLISVRYFTYRMTSYERTAFDYSRTAAGFIDGDRIKDYLETGEKDEYYYEIRDYLNVARRETDIEYYYVIVPMEDEFVYIWDAEELENTENPDGYDLGYREKYSSEADKNAMLKVMQENPPENVIMDVEENYGFLASAYSPVFNSAGEAVAIVGVDLSVPSVLNAILQFMLMILMTVCIITGIGVVILYFNLNRSVLSPLGKLTRSAGETIENIDKNESKGLGIKTGDEIEDLADAFTKMDGDLKAYIKELSEATAERERISAELNVAANIQEDMLPREFPPFPDRTEFDLFADMHPAREVGGDFYDFFMVDDDHIALVMADVSGKGIPAALFMVVSKIYIKNSVQSGMSPAEALVWVNDQLLENNNTGLFVTVWLAVINFRTGRGIAANAGHMHPVLKRRDGEYELVKYKHSPAVSTIKGIPFREHDFELRPGDMLFVYTDGVTEATNAEEELFGDDRMLEVLNANGDAGAEELLPAVKEALDEFVGEAPQFDDITMLAFKYKGAK